MEIVWFMAVGLIAGVLARLFVKGGGYGIVGDIVIGMLGALLGGFVFGSAGLPVGSGLLRSIVVATLGAVLLILLLRLLKRT